MTVVYTIEAHPTTYRNVRFRSRLEATWAAFFDQMEWRWDYEPFDLKGWSPDFRLKGKTRDVLVEVKPIDSFDEDVAYKMLYAAEDKFDLLLCGTTPVINKTLDPIPEGSSISLYSCCCCDHSNCWWMPRNIIKLENKFDIVFRHHPYFGFSTGIDVDGLDLVGHWEGDEIMARWARAKNAVQWRGPRKS